MKLMSVTAPLMIVALTGVAVSGMGMLAVRAAAVSTRSDIELLRMHLRVARLHEQLLRHSRNGLGAEVRSLLPGGAAAGAVAAPAAGAGAVDVSTLPQVSQVRPWPDEAMQR
jgi:hypothetical protein